MLNLNSKSLDELYNVTKAYLKIDDNNKFTVQFNPTSLNITDGVNYTSTNTSTQVVGRKIPTFQYTSHKTRELTIKLLFDTYTSYKPDSEKEDVSNKIKEFLKLITNVEATGRPPDITFSWGSIEFNGVVTNFSYEYILFTREGNPVRAWLNLTLNEYFLI